MFSGIVETTGIITAIYTDNGCVHLHISPKLAFTDLTLGASIAVNGVCLTVTHYTDTDFTVTVVPETKRLTNFKQVHVGQIVNLERALKLGDRMSGHYVQGHVDTTGELISLEYDTSDALIAKVSLVEKIHRYVVTKGYITLDGMSITVINVAPDWFTVTFIPHTQHATIIPHYTPGTLINIEVDIVGKYIEKMMGAYTHANNHT